MELIEAKITAMLSIGLGSILMGILPAVLAKYGRTNWPLLLSTMLCFGAGVLFSTSLVHMLFEFREAMPKYAELIYCCGFFIVYCIDELVHIFSGDGHIHEIATHSDYHNFRPRSLRRHSVDNYGSIDNHNFLEPTEEDTLVHGQRRISQICHVGHEEPCTSTQTGTIGLLVALCVHAVLEGLAVGVENSTSQVLLMLGAVASHKLVVGFCLGAELSTAERTNNRFYFASIIVFSVGSVLGIGIGMLITEIPKDISNIVLPTLQGLAAGTLLYVTVSEILPRERARWHQNDSPKYAGAIQFASVAVGFSAMTAITKYLEP